MKKYFYLAAVSAMMLTACSSENDVVQPTTQPTTPQVTVQQQAVAFDTYLSGTTASTRAGYEGVMTTEKLKKAEAGFGVFAFYQNGVDYPATNSSLKPDFMYNEKLTWNSGWTYSPLKYWPNETLNDSQDPAALMPGPGTPGTKIDKLSFFAYAPYVSAGSGTTGITALSTNAATTDPKVTFTINTDPDQNVDLLWGVAPAGFSYTNVSGTTTSVPVGMPLKDLVKPDKDQKVKFLFQHALSRIGLSVVSAIDQIAAGDDAGTFTSDPTTKVLIKSVTITGPFGTTGTLNLNNTTANQAKWESITADAGSTALFTINGATTDGDTGTGNYYLAPDLRYVGSQITAVGTNADDFANVNTGVLPSEQSLLAGDADPSKAVSGTPTYQYGKVYYISAGVSDKGYVIAKATTENTSGYKVYSKSKEGNYALVYTGDGTSAGFVVDGTTEYFTLTGDDAVATVALTAPTGSDPSKYYWTKNATTGVFEIHELKVGDSDVAANSYYALTPAAVEATYPGNTYWSGLIPRYFMVIPTGAAIDIAVNIKYAVVTKDTKLGGNVSNVENDITKKVSVDLKNGKSYNLKLILGLTSVKLDASVADWKVADDTEIWLPQNNE